MAAKLPQPTVAELRQAFQELFDALNEAFWVVSTIEDKDRIHGLGEAVYRILCEIERADLAARTEAYLAVKAKVDEATRRLGKLKKKLDDIIHAMDTAAAVTRAIDKALDVAARFFV